MLAPRCVGPLEDRDQASRVLDTTIKYLRPNALRDGEGTPKGCRHHPSCRRGVSSWGRRRNERRHRSASTRAPSIPPLSPQLYPTHPARRCHIVLSYTFIHTIVKKNLGSSWMCKPHQERRTRSMGCRYQQLCTQGTALPVLGWRHCR